MANTYTQLYIQCVFAVQNRLSMINPSWEEELYRYISGIVRNHKHKYIIMNGMPDHVHLFIGLHPAQSVSTLMQIVKGEFSEWINNKDFVKGKFQWQEGYGAFSYSRSWLERVYNYIKDQKEHHKKESFIDEYKKMLEKFNIDFDERYILKAVDWALIFRPYRDGLFFLRNFYKDIVPIGTALSFRRISTKILSLTGQVFVLNLLHR